MVTSASSAKICISLRHDISDYIFRSRDWFLSDCSLCLLEHALGRRFAPFGAFHPSSYDRSSQSRAARTPRVSREPMPLDRARFLQKAWDTAGMENSENHQIIWLCFGLRMCRVVCRTGHFSATLAAPPFDYAIEPLWKQI